ncbi:hypothetical protein EV363DRAFT_1350395 [Boletus edulis]|nr:hypothetical protein EV363DRAFT_1350395 [Boletus edulis]
MGRSACQNILMTVFNSPTTASNILPTNMYPPIQYFLVGTLFLISAVIMAISCFLGYTHSKLDVLLVVFSVISFFIACDQYRRALVTWQAKRSKLAAIESNV